MTGNVVPCPVYADGIVYLTSGFRGNALLAIRLAGAEGDITDSESVVWTLDAHTPYTPSPLLHGGLIYMLLRNNGILSCFDARTGQEHFTRQRLRGLNVVYASPVGVDGRVYIVGKNGTTLVIKHGPTYQLLETNVLDDQFTASPAVVKDELFLRGHRALYCIGRSGRKFF